MSALAVLTTAGVMTWSEAKATPFADINELIGILNEWDRRRAQQQEQMRR